MKTVWIVILFASAIALYGCSPSQASSGISPVVPSESVVPPTTAPKNDTAQPPPPKTDITVPDKTLAPDENAQKLAPLAKEDLATELQISFDDIVLSSVAAVVWPDASLGCPQPDMAYTQILTPGFLITLEASGKQYFYHTDESSTVIACPEGGLPEFPLTPGEIQDGKPWMPIP